MMDYEKLIEHLRECGTYGFKQEECRDASTAIETLCAENEKLKEDKNKAIERLSRIIKLAHEQRDAVMTDLARVTAERDAAVKYLKKWNICATCGHYSPHGKKSNCKIKSAHISGGNWAGCSEWEWRGMREERLNMASESQEALI